MKSMNISVPAKRGSIFCSRLAGPRTPKNLSEARRALARRDDHCRLKILPQKNTNIFSNFYFFHEKFENLKFGKIKICKICKNYEL